MTPRSPVSLETDFKSIYFFLSTQEMRVITLGYFHTSLQVIFAAGREVNMTGTSKNQVKTLGSFQ